MVEKVALWFYGLMFLAGTLTMGWAFVACFFGVIAINLIGSWLFERFLGPR